MRRLLWFVEPWMVGAIVALPLLALPPRLDGSTQVWAQEHEDRPVLRHGVRIDGKSYWFYEGMGMLENLRTTDKGVEGTYTAAGWRTDFVIGTEQVADVSARSFGYRMAIEKIIFYMSPTASVPDNELNRKYVASLTERLKKMTGMDFKGYADWKKWLDANGDKLRWSTQKNVMVVEYQK